MIEQVILIGISGSGKSTFAEQFMSNNPEYVRVNRDGLRETLVPNHSDIWYTPEFKTYRITHESLINNLIKQIKETNNYIINDNTNLNLKFIKQDLLQCEHNHIIIINRSHEVNDCIESDKQRSRTVGENIIKKQYNQFLDIVEKINILAQDQKYNIKGIDYV